MLLLIIIFFLFERHVELDDAHYCQHYIAVQVLATGLSWLKVYEEGHIVFPFLIPIALSRCYLNEF
jgi:hypothetical protein